MSPWITYTLARLGFFSASLVILLLVGTGWVWGAIFATLISFALSVLLLGGLRHRIASDIRRRVEKPATDIDSDVEDDQIDSATN
jgi:hypothetical protein